MNTISIAFRNFFAGEGARIDVYAGKYVYNPQRYVISKDNVLKLYNGVATTSTENYEVLWCARNGYYSTGKMDKIAIRQDVADSLVKNDGTEVSMEDMTSNVGIYFTNCSSLDENTGYIKVYNDDTNELIETFTKSNWGKYTKSNPYKYSEPIKHIRVETSEIKPRAQVNIYNVRELDDEYLSEKYSMEEFEEFGHIKTSIICDIDDEYFCRTVQTANYEGTASVAKVTMDKTSLSTQMTEKNAEIKIVTETSSYENRAKWTNGTFLLKLPKEIIDIEINDVNINNDNVEVISYDAYQEGENTFIKILTANETPASYEITINCDVTPDPRIVTVSKNIELYASNENCEIYSYRGKDVYDVNGNLNVDEYVNLSSLSLNLVSPGTLLTNQIANNYDAEGSVAVAPQNAIVSKDQRKATVEMEIKNGYTNTISDVVILGKFLQKEIHMQ